MGSGGFGDKGLTIERMLGQDGVVPLRTGFFLCGGRVYARLGRTGVVVVVMVV